MSKAKKIEEIRELANGKQEPLREAPLFWIKRGNMYETEGEGPKTILTEEQFEKLDRRQRCFITDIIYVVPPEESEENVS